jgi:RNA polymerase sporulation-specific sigma factor
MNETSREPTVDELAQMLELPKADVVFALESIQEPVSLYEPAYNDGTDALFVMDQVKDTKNNDETWLKEIVVKEAMAKLTDREKHILSLRFFAGRTQMEVAKEIGISQAQVSRLEKSAISHMKKYV